LYVKLIFKKICVPLGISLARLVCLNWLVSLLALGKEKQAQKKNQEQLPFGFSVLVLSGEKAVWGGGLTNEVLLGARDLPCEPWGLGMLGHTGHRPSWSSRPASGGLEGGQGSCHQQLGSQLAPNLRASLLAAESHFLGR
jgi:hypothetical protein